MTPNYWKTATQWLLTMLEHWGIIVKLKTFHTFWISYWNLEYFTCICILCIFMDMKKFRIEISLTCAKIYFNPIKINIKPTLWSCRYTLELKFSFILFLFAAMNFQSFQHSFTTCENNPCSTAIHFMLPFSSRGTHWASFALSLHPFW